MSNFEREFAEDLYKYGAIVYRENYDCDGVAVESYEIEAENARWMVTRNNGEWTYLTRLF